MTVLAIAVGAVAACRGAEPTVRDRLLAQLPGDAIAVVAADGRALAHPRVRAVLDIVAARWPAGMDCVLEAAYAGEQVAAGVDAAGNVAVVVAAAGEPRCPALSQREPGQWIATLGAGPGAITSSVLDGERFARARPYLQTAPIAAAVLGDVRVIAAAQPEPLEAWLAIDADVAPAGTAGAPRSPADAIAEDLTAQIAKLAGEPAAAALARHLQVTRPAAGQVVVKLDGGADVDLAAAARTIVGWAEQRSRPPVASFRCPPPSGAAEPEITCSQGTRYGVPSLRRALLTIAAHGAPQPLVVSGAVTGLRLGAAVAPLGLAAGDVVIALDGRLVVSRTMFLHLVSQASTEATVTVRRGTTERDLHFVER